MKMEKPILAKRIFWDTNFENLDYDKSYKSIIERVFDWGDIDDIRQVRRYYGDEKVIHSLTNAMYLFDETIHFCSAIFEIPKENFKCYISKQSHPIQSGF
jgi:hypothetical protein